MPTWSRRILRKSCQSCSRFWPSRSVRSSWTGAPACRREPAGNNDSTHNREGKMRALRYALGPLVVVALAAPAWAGEVYVIETSQGSKPIAVKKDTAALAAVPNIGEGRPNQGFNYGSLY